MAGTNSSLRRTTTLAWVLFACLGCTGKITSPGTGGPGTSGGAGPGGGATGPGATTGPGTTAPPGPAGGLGNTFIDQDSPALERLTNVEYSRTVTDVFGEPADAATRYSFPSDPTQHGFDNNVALLQISSTHAGDYATAAESIATATLADPTRRALVASCDLTTAACLQTMIPQLGRRLYRRPLTPDEIAGFTTLAQAGAIASDPYSGPATVIEGMLDSPHFLYRVQLGVSDPERAGIVGLSGFEMATRLSYLLLGTTPSDALLDQAAAGALDTTAGANQVVKQMLADPLARRGVKRFYEQWLPLDEMSGPTADAERIPHMGDTVLAADLAEETSRFVDDVWWDAGGAVPDILTSRYTFVNANLAMLYGLPVPATVGAWQKVTFDASSTRAGVLTQGSIMAAGSHNGTTSNTRRGQMVREQLLCQDIPAPPPGVNANLPPPTPGETEQQTFARHTTDASCAACHTLMDPIGWGLSGFDAAGVTRTKDSNGQPISTKGQISGMMPPDFNGPVELGQKVAASPQFEACFARQLFRYVYGRVETTADEQGITELEGSFTTASWDLRGGIAALVGSDGFRYRNRGDAP